MTARIRSRPRSAPNARPEDLRQPGHVFPLMAQPGGVLTRAGHTEAGCDLARLAGFSPAAMIVEILNDDGTMARRPDLELFAKTHGLKIGTIADLIRYRLKNERSVERIYEEHRGYRVRHVQAVLLRGSRQQNRAHRPGQGRFEFRRCRRWCACISTTRCATWSASATSGSAGRCTRRCAGSPSEPSGVVVILRPGGDRRGISWTACGCWTPRPRSTRHHGATVIRTYGIGAQILKDLGLKRMRVLSAPEAAAGSGRLRSGSHQLCRWRRMSAADGLYCAPYCCEE